MGFMAGIATPGQIWGNYGGLGWCGGVRVPPGGKCDFTVKPIDWVDVIFRQHDIDYEEAKARLDAGDLSSYWHTTIAADQKLIDDLVHQIGRPANSTRDMDVMAERARGAFQLKQWLINYPWSRPASEPPVGWEGWGSISPFANDLWKRATAPPPRDPLAIDLDGDGMETVGIPTNGTPILFDHDADGLKSGTGWVMPDDGWLTFDRNGNGAIDSGRELFGVDTLIDVGGYQRNAYSGFEALSSLDLGSGGSGTAGSGDKLIDSRDAAFTQLRVWRDLNQDGVSQAGELMTLAAAGIQSIGLTTTASNVNLGNGNAVTATATVTRTNGGSTQINSVGLSASNLNLGSNPFYRKLVCAPPSRDVGCS